MIAVFLNNLVPYHHARWTAYARMHAAECLLIEISGRDAFQVLEFDGGDACAFQRETLFPGASFDHVPRREMIQAVHRVLDKHQPQLVCLNGYSFPYNWAALDWCLRNKVPTVVCSESNESDEVRRPWKEAIKRFFIRHCAAGLAGGRPQAEYLVKLGLASEAVFTGYDVVDNHHFQAGAADARAHADEIRNKLGLTEKYFLTCSRFGEKKNLPLLVKAYARYRQLMLSPNDGNEESQVWDLVLIGEGEERALIEKAMMENEVRPWVHLVGAKSYHQLPEYYGLASAFVHASTTEQWGLVVNEAMASGLPVLVSNRCGCAPDLVKDEVNGFTFNPWDTEDIARQMLRISTAGTSRVAMGEASREIIAQWSPEKFAHGVAQAAKVALSGPPPRSTWFARWFIQAFLRR